MKLQVHIKKKLGKFKLDVSFESDKGVLAILGASGCGKSMTLKCIAGIETPDEGRIVLGDKVLFDSEKKINLPPQKRNVGYMFQDYALFPTMTVRKNIEIARKGKPIEDDFFEKFHLAGLEDHYPAQLSGGQKQRTAMARMLAAEPEMIILDEPFSALDSYLKWELEQEVRQLLKQLGKPVLLVSHDRDEVYRVSEYVAAMVDGKLDEIQEVREFFHNPKKKISAVLSGCKNVAAAVKISDHKVYVKDWGLEIETEEEVPYTEGFVGIRAHFFEPLYGEIRDSNYFAVEETLVVEDPFEWTLSYRKKGYERWIVWRVSKDSWQYGVNDLPTGFYIAPENVLILL